MEKELFPWKESTTQATPGPVLEVSKDTKTLVLDSIKKYAPLYVLLFLILLVLIFRPVDNKNPLTKTDSTIDVLVVMLPTPKGSEIYPETLKSVPVREKSLTNSQALQVIRGEDIPHLKGKLVAKKNLGPNKPLFWNDVEFKVAAGARKAPKIIYPKENP